MSIAGSWALPSILRPLQMPGPLANRIPSTRWLPVVGQFIYSRQRVTKTDVSSRFPSCGQYKLSLQATVMSGANPCNGPSYSSFDRKTLSTAGFPVSGSNNAVFRKFRFLSGSPSCCRTFPLVEIMYISLEGFALETNNPDPASLGALKGVWVSVSLATG